MSRQRTETSQQPSGLPHSEESERAVLACVLLNPGLAPHLFELLTPEMFYLERHQLIYTSYKRVVAEGNEIDLRTLQADLESTQSFEVVGGFAYLAGLSDDLPDLGRFETYCGLVRERWARRSLVLEISETATAALDSGEDTSELIAKVQDAMLRIDRDRSPGGKFRRIGDIVLDLDVFTEKPGGMLGMSTGLIDLDRYTLGAQPGQLWIIAGRPSMGKTSLAVQVAQHQAATGHRVGFVSLEDIEERLAIKLISQISDVPHQRLALGRITRGERPKIVDAMRTLDSQSLFIDDTAGQTVQQIASASRQLATQNGLDCLFVDYLSLLRAAGNQENRNLEIGFIAESLKNLAKALRIPVVLLSQLSRKVEQRSDKRPMLSDLRDSGEIEQHADVVLFCYRGERYYPDDDELRGLAEVIIAKNKFGETGLVELVFVGETTSFRNLERNQPESSYEQQRAW